MAKYEIIYDKKTCIGVTTCVAIAPQLWKISKEELRKPDLRDSKLIDKEKEIFKSEITEGEFKIALESALGCPVNAIHIIENATKKHLI